MNKNVPVAVATANWYIMLFVDKLALKCLSPFLTIHFITVSFKSTSLYINYEKTILIEQHWLIFTCLPLHIFLMLASNRVGFAIF